MSIRISCPNAKNMLYVEHFNLIPANTRASKIQAIISEIKAYEEDTMPQDIFIAVLRRNGIAPESLTPGELNRICQAIKD